MEPPILSIREKKIYESVNNYFKDVDDDILKTIVLYTALNKTEEEKDAICEVLKRKKEEDEKYIQQFELVIDKDTPNAEKVIQLIQPEEVPLPEEKYTDNIEKHGDD